MKRILGLMLLLAGSLLSANLPLEVKKTPTEAFNLAGEYSLVVGSHGITVVEVVAIDVDSGADVTSTVIASAPTPVTTTSVVVSGQTKTGQYLLFRVQAGTNGQRVLIRATAADAVTGERWDALFMVSIVSNTGR